MPLHLLGKKSWNVYNADNIARVKRDEAAAAAAEAAKEQRMQEQDAARRMAILRGEAPSPLPEADDDPEEKSRKTDSGASGHDRKRRRLAGEDDTARDIRLAKGATAPRDEEDIAVLKLRPTSDAPLTDHAGHINLFPVDEKEAIKRQRKEDADREKKKKEQALEDQYTMRFSNAAGKSGLKGPWYTANGGLGVEKDDDPNSATTAVEYAGYVGKDVWGNEDPSRKEREQKRVFSNDPLALVNRGVADLKKYKDQKKKVTAERAKELRELKAEQEEEDKRRKHRKRKQQDEARRSAKTHTDEHQRSKDHHYSRDHKNSSRREEREYKESARSEGRHRNRSRERSYRSRDGLDQASSRSIRERRRSRSPDR